MLSRSQHWAVPPGCRCDGRTFKQVGDKEMGEMTTTAIKIFGDCAPGFEPVKAAFERNFSEHGEVGGAVAVTIDGESKVDLWGGHADEARSRSPRRRRARA